MIKTKGSNELRTLTAIKFAEGLLYNPNKIYRFKLNPNDDTCFFISSVGLFGSQAVLISAGRMTGDVVIGVPDATHAFSIRCYDTAWQCCYDREECIKNIVDGLEGFGFIGEFYVLNDKKESKLELVYS